MPASQEPNVGLYYGWALGESGWNVQMDSNLKAIGALLALGVLSATTGTPPGSPASGDRYLVPASGTTGAWVGVEGKLVAWDGSVWQAFTARNSWNVLAVDTGQRWVRAAGAWVLEASLLGQYADDTAAASGGVPLDGVYVNSSTGALTVRLV